LADKKAGRTADCSEQRMAGKMAEHLAGWRADLSAAHWAAQRVALWGYKTAAQTAERLVELRAVP
jgi:hypothetical protein